VLETIISLLYAKQCMLVSERDWGWRIELLSQSFHNSCYRELLYNLYLVELSTITVVGILGLGYTLCECKIIYYLYRTPSVSIVIQSCQ